MTGTAVSPSSADGFPRAQAVVLVVFFSALFCMLTLPVTGPDFWWHLASGRWLWEHRVFPQADPFDFTSALFSSSSQVGYLLTLTWLAQLLLYAVFRLAGLTGAVLLQAAVSTALFVLLLRLLRRTGAGMLSATLLLALAVQAVVRELVYIEIRPQMWSSLFFVVLLLLLENIRDGKRWARFALPALMLLWANLHGGYILGVIVLVIATAAAHLSRHGERRRILLVAIAAIALTGCNPAGYETLLAYPRLRLSDSGAFLTGVFEESPLFNYLKITALPGTMPALAALLLLPPLTLLPRLRSLRGERWDLFLIYLLVLGMGIKAQRYLVFMVPAACLITVLNLTAIRKRLVRTRCGPFLLRAPPRAIAVLTALALLALAVAYGRVAARSSLLRPAAAFHHNTEAAADYLAGNGLTGNVFNEYAAGGYLAWRLAPAMKIFIYGRLVSPELLTLYNEMIYQPSKSASLVSSGGVYLFYQKVLDQYGIDTVVIPAGDSRSGDVIPLAVRLAQDDAWALTVAQPRSLVFLRKTAAPAALVGKALPKSAVYDAMISVATGASRSSHGRSVPVWRRTIAYATYLKGRKSEALRLFDDYLLLAPEDTQAGRLRTRIANEIGGVAPGG